VFEAFHPKTFSDGARSLEIDPFELIRLLVLSDSMPLDLVVGEEHLERARHFGGIGSLLGDEVSGLDFSDRSALLKVVLQRMMESGQIGQQTLRLDNIWRGMEAEAIEFLQNAITALVEHGYLDSYSSVRSVQVSISADALDAVRAIVDGEVIPSELMETGKL